uniref:Uncharacterized protein n=1 Tax=Rhabditophanes sp. KR3021 TaxID=114890 RepID=A0AC35U5X7_9BILA
MQTCFNIISIILVSLIVLHMSKNIVAETDALEKIEDKRYQPMEFAKRYPSRFAFAKKSYGSRFAFAKRSNEEPLEDFEDDGVVVGEAEEKRGFNSRFAFAKRGYGSKFAFAKKAYPRGFAFA